MYDWFQKLIKNLFKKKKQKKNNVQWMSPDKDTAKLNAQFFIPK